MNKLNKAFLLLIVAVGFMCSANTCGESFPNDMSFAVQNNSGHIIYVWNIIEKQDFDIFKEGYSIYEQPYTVLAPGEYNRNFNFDYPEDLHDGFKYKPTDESENAKINYIIILKKETFVKNSIDKLTKDKIYDAMYILKPREIINMHYTIYYPENSRDTDSK